MNIINNSNIEVAKNLIKKSAEKPIIVNAIDDNFNRKILEFGKLDVLLFSEEFLLKRKINTKHNDSGFNHVLGKIASINNVSIGFDLNQLRNLDKKDKAIVISKIIQNIKISRKTKNKIVILNYKDKKDVFSLLLSLGSSTQQAINAL